MHTYVICETRNANNNNNNNSHSYDNEWYKWGQLVICMRQPAVACNDNGNISKCDELQWTAGAKYTLKDSDLLTISASPYCRPAALSHYSVLTPTVMVVQAASPLPHLPLLSLPPPFAAIVIVATALLRSHTHLHIFNHLRPTCVYLLPHRLGPPCPSSTFFFVRVFAFMPATFVSLHNASAQTHTRTPHATSLRHNTTWRHLTTLSRPTLNNTHRLHSFWGSIEFRVFAVNLSATLI